MAGKVIECRRCSNQLTIPAAQVAQAPKIKITCSKCHKSLTAKQALAGKKIRCPICRESISIPTTPPLPSRKISTPKMDSESCVKCGRITTRIYGYTALGSIESVDQSNLDTRSDDILVVGGNYVLLHGWSPVCDACISTEYRISRMAMRAALFAFAAVLGAIGGGIALLFASSDTALAVGGVIALLCGFGFMLSMAETAEQDYNCIGWRHSKDANEMRLKQSGFQFVSWSHKSLDEMVTVNSIPPSTFIDK